MNEEANLAVEGPMAKGRLKRIQEEGKVRSSGKKARSSRKELNLVQKDTQSVNAKVEDLSKGKEKRPKVASIHESERSFEARNYSEGTRSSWSSLGDRCERQVRVERNRREERRERQSREELDMCKCKILPLLGNCNPEVYVDWELKVKQILGCFNLHGRMVVRLVTLEFGDYALIWWTQMLEDIRRGIKDLCEDWVGTYIINFKGYNKVLGVEKYHKEMEMDLMRAQI
ncbi:hypothetical protein CR513_18854, partial [Mucuna pruriens]